jgi:hypothetical protein
MLGDPHVRFDECEDVVNGRDAIAGYFLIEELRLLFVYRRCGERHQDLSATLAGKFDAKELRIANGRGAIIRRGARVYVKHHNLRVCTTDARTSGVGQQHGVLNNHIAFTRGRTLDL